MGESYIELQPLDLKLEGLSYDNEVCERFIQAKNINSKN